MEFDSELPDYYKNYLLELENEMKWYHVLWYKYLRV
jgi:hypothetical protein